MGLVIADTNSILYSIKGLPAIEPFLDAEFALSEIELPGVKDIHKNELTIRKNSIHDFFILYFNQAVKELAVELKQKYTVKIPDAIIAASAIHFKLPLLTADKGFLKLKEVDVIPLTISDP